eukprot:scaffold51787_cov30-Tisochrysis_lutea.AAC.3
MGPSMTERSVARELPGSVKVVVLTVHKRERGALSVPTVSNKHKAIGSANGSWHSSEREPPKRLSMQPQN